MSAKLFVSKRGKVSTGGGNRSKESLVFAPSNKNSAQVIREQRETTRQNSKIIKDRYQIATQR